LKRHEFGSPVGQTCGLLVRVLDGVRDNTFHYPSPNTSYSPSSDERLRNVIAGLRDRAAEMHLDHRGSHPVVTVSFAGDVALALALAKHSADETTAREHFDLVLTYLKATPQLIDDTARQRLLTTRTELGMFRSER
jgi:hypothetical protein